MKRVKVTGYINIEEHEYDTGRNGPLTEQAWTEWMTHLSVMDDVEFEEADDD